jgi:hypothetical protein
MLGLVVLLPHGLIQLGIYLYSFLRLDTSHQRTQPAVLVFAFGQVFDTDQQVQELPESRFQVCKSRTGLDQWPLSELMTSQVAEMHLLNPLELSLTGALLTHAWTCHP